MPRAAIFFAPAPLDGVVDADDERSRGQEPIEDHRQQLAGDGAAVPARLAEHMVVEGEVAGLRQAHDAQCGAHRALARCEHDAGNQHQDVIPDRCREEAPEGRHQGDEDRRYDRGCRT